jgi:hypothetical protein
MHGLLSAYCMSGGGDTKRSPSSTDGMVIHAAVAER